MRAFIGRSPETRQASVAQSTSGGSFALLCAPPGACRRFPAATLPISTPSASSAAHSTRGGRGGRARARCCHASAAARSAPALLENCKGGGDRDAHRVRSDQKPRLCELVLKVTLERGAGLRFNARVSGSEGKAARPGAVLCTSIATPIVPPCRRARRRPSQYVLRDVFKFGFYAHSRLIRVGEACVQGAAAAARREPAQPSAHLSRPWSPRTLTLKLRTVRFSIFGVIHSMTERSKHSNRSRTRMLFVLAVAIDAAQVRAAALETWAELASCSASDIPSVGTK